MSPIERLLGVKPSEQKTTKAKKKKGGKK